MGTFLAVTVVQKGGRFAEIDFAIFCSPLKEFCEHSAMMKVKECLFK